MSQEDTDEQKAIIAFIQSGKGHLLIDALAGSGKTSTLLRALHVLPQKSALLCAFNKPIADELTLKIGKPPPGSMWKAATFHSLGLKIVHHHRPRLDVRAEVTEDFVNEAAESWEASAAMKGDRVRVSFQVRRTAVRLLRFIKEIFVERELSATHARVLAESNDMLGKLADEDRVVTCEVTSIAYRLGLDLGARRGLDFCDMVWLPVVLDLAPPSRYQVVFVDEAQDLSLPQLSLVKRLVAPNGRLVTVGDLRQAIYKWRGAIGENVWREMREAYKAEQLPLTMTFRCSRAVVKAANEIVPQLKARPNAPEGSVKSCSFEKLPELLRKEWHIDTFVLSRNNADLLHTALYLWKTDLGFTLRAGKEIIEPLYEIIDKLDKSTKDRFSSSLTTWYQTEMGKAERVHASAWADRIEQQYNSLLMMLGYAEPRSFKQILQDLMNSSGESRIMLSTVHKVKGLEADRVYLLKQTFSRHRYRQQIEEAVDDWHANLARSRLANIDPEELNLEYVAITRAKEALIWVDMRGAAAETLAKVWEAKLADAKES